MAPHRTVGTMAAAFKGWQGGGSQGWRRGLYVVDLVSRMQHGEVGLHSRMQRVDGGRRGMEAWRHGGMEAWFITVGREERDQRLSSGSQAIEDLGGSVISPSPIAHHGRRRVHRFSSPNANPLPRPTAGDAARLEARSGGHKKAASRVVRHDSRASRVRTNRLADDANQGCGDGKSTAVKGVWGPLTIVHSAEHGPGIAPCDEPIRAAIPAGASGRSWEDDDIDSPGP